MKFSDVIKIEEEKIRSHVDEVVRDSVESTLNELLDAEADELCGAKRYERSAERVDTRAGSYTRKLQTKAGEVSLKVPRLRSLPFETQITERYRRRESSVEEALMEMYLAGVSVRRVEDITEASAGRFCSLGRRNARRLPARPRRAVAAEGSSSPKPLMTHDENSCVGSLEHLQPNDGSFLHRGNRPNAVRELCPSVRSHPPALDALTALRAQTDRPSVETAWC